MLVEKKTRPAWAEEFLVALKEPTPQELARRRKVFERTMRHRVSIAPDRVTDYIRELRGPLPESEEYAG